MKASEYLKEKDYHEVEYIHGDTVEEFLDDFAKREAIEFYLSMIFPNGFGGDDIADRRNFELTVRAKVKKEYQKFKDES